MARRRRGGDRASARAGHSRGGGAYDPRRSERAWHERVLPRPRRDVARADFLRELVRGASADPARELRQRAHERGKVFWPDTRRAAEHLVALDLPRDRKCRRLVDEPRHQPEVEERTRESTIW